MAETTGISWCDHTMNFWVGCTKVSPACDGCYAEEQMDHRYHRVEWGGPRVRTSAENWKQPYRWNRAALAAGERRGVFSLSLGDFFDNHHSIAPAWRSDAWVTIADCGALDWYLLTKRPQNVPKMLPSTTCEVMAAGKAWPWPHVLIGCTVENQEEADRRRPHMERIAATGTRVFVSYEPALGPVDWAGWEFISWLISGGETDQGKHKARPSHPDWHRAARDFCTVHGIAYHFKQWGEFSPDARVSSTRVLSHVWPDGRHCAYGDLGQPGYRAETGTYQMARVGKSRAGRMLDGQVHDGRPG